MRHAGLANEREGLFGGEIRTTKNSIALNVISGSFTKKLIRLNHDPSASILERFGRLLNKSESLKGKIGLRTVAFPKTTPSILQVQEHCNSVSFFESNRDFCKNILK